MTNASKFSSNVPRMAIAQLLVVSGYPIEDNTLGRERYDHNFIVYNIIYWPQYR